MKTPKNWDQSKMAWLPDNVSRNDGTFKAVQEPFVDTWLGAEKENAIQNMGPLAAVINYTQRTDTQMIKWIHQLSASREKILTRDVDCPSAIFGSEFKQAKQEACYKQGTIEATSGKTDSVGDKSTRNSWQISTKCFCSTCLMIIRSNHLSIMDALAV